MLSVNNTFSFGRYLQTFRMESGKSIEDLSRETKIGVHYLTAIENEQIDRLPQEVFVKGFLRAYSRAVNADGSEAVSRYLACIGGSETKKSEPEIVLKKSDGGFWKRIVLLSGVLLLIIIMSVASVSIISESGSGEKNGERGASAAGKEASGNEKHIGPQTTDKVSGVVSGELHLEISVIKDTWMKVMIDGQNPREYLLNRGDLLELKALKGFNLLAGDAGAIRLNFNGRELDIPRESGRAANIQIP